MVLELRLERAGKKTEPGGVLVWNEDTGELTGYMVSEVMKEAELAKQDGNVGFTPLGLYSEKDPLRDREAMAILLMSMGYIVPQQLRDSYEVADRDIPGAVY